MLSDISFSTLPWRVWSVVQQRHLEQKPLLFTTTRLMLRFRTKLDVEITSVNCLLAEFSNEEPPSNFSLVRSSKCKLLDSDWHENWSLWSWNYSEELARAAVMLHTICLETLVRFFFAFFSSTTFWLISFGCLIQQLTFTIPPQSCQNSWEIWSCSVSWLLMLHWACFSSKIQAWHILQFVKVVHY